MKKFFFDCGTRDATASFGLLILRISIGLLLLLGHGLPKIQNYSHLSIPGHFKVPDLFPFDHMSVQVSVISLIVAEVGAAALLILGLAGRPASFVIGFAMVVAAFGTHGADPWFLSPAGKGAKEPALLYLIPSITLLLTGAGRYSVDALVPADKKRRKW